MIDIIFISDPGHGWMQVPTKLFHEIEKKLKRPIPISDFSYTSLCHDYYYLEEDCDAGEFHKALLEIGWEHKRDFTYSDIHVDDFSRSKPPFTRDLDRSKLI